MVDEKLKHEFSPEYCDSINRMDMARARAGHCFCKTVCSSIHMHAPMLLNDKNKEDNNPLVLPSSEKA
jgi:hypothetical protein